jgi:hypothetical protein
MSNRFVNSLITAVVVIMFFGCTKTVKLSHEPAYQILGFEVPTGYGNISGVINEDSNTITIQLPYYLYDLVYVNPNIKIPESATVSPASGERISLNESPVTYTVTTSGGATSTYKVIREYLQLKTSIEELSAATNTVMYRMAGGIGLNGKNIITDTNYVKVLLAKPGGKAVSLTPTSVGKSAIYFTIFDNNTIDTGLYYVTVKNLAETVNLRYPIRVKYPVPVIEMDSYRNTKKQGDTLMVNGYFIRNIDSLGIYKGSGSVSQEASYNFLKVQSYTRNQVTFKVPDDFPVASYPASPGTLYTCQKYADTAFFKSYYGSQLVVQPK